MKEALHPAPAVESMDGNDAAARIKGVAIKAGIDVIGIAPVERWDDAAPEGHRPGDILPGARSVVVLGARGPTAGAWKCPQHRFIEVNGYDFRNDMVTHVTADYIEREFDHYAIMAPALSVSGHQPVMAMMLAAVLAGLGTRSLAANIILNPKYGLLYYSACITTLELPGDPMLEQNVCPHPMCVATYLKIGKTPCIAACPSDDGGCLDGKLDDDGRISYSYFDRERCSSRSMNFGINTFQKAMEQIVTEDDPESQTNMIYSDFFRRSCNAVTHFRESVAQCFECMRVCPITRQERKLK